MLLKLFDQSINLPDVWINSQMGKPCCVGVGGPLCFSSTRHINHHLPADVPVKC
ncbi:hypothetical protein DDI_2527 [Dickeya dianthicola RNS04.9]|nr:hypothetical protein DDI_2527 [Dickeya dianthicola RNS04.9]MBQ4797190.1 hypothetical protein [Pectobacterium versatile]